MSRSYCSYDEDWQRRKSVLIRSLFHDIPILSPVDEESNDSYHYSPQEAFPPPDRPYSPLPPLIIEKVQPVNKHDEPEVFYRKLHNKIKKIYLKLFVENRSLDSDDYDLNYNDSSIVDSKVTDCSEDESVKDQNLNFLESISPSRANFNSTQEEETEESTDSNHTNGYESDLESMDTEDIDIVNYTATNNGDSLRSDKEKTDGHSIHEAKTSDKKNNEARADNEKSSASKESSRSVDSPESIDEEDSSISNIDYQNTERKESIATDVEISCEEEQSVRTINIRKRKIIEEVSNSIAAKRVFNRDCIEEQKSSPEREESNEVEKEQNCEKDDLINENIDENKITKRGSQNEESDKVSINKEVSKSPTIDDHESTESETSKEFEERQQSKDLTEPALDPNNKTKNPENTHFEERDKLTAINVQMTEEDVETSQSSEGIDYRQITTLALVHFDGSQDAEDKESIVYEDSIKSVILPTRFRKLTISRNVDVDDRIEVLPVLEEHADPKLVSTFDKDESETTEEDFEDIRALETEATDEDIAEEETTCSAAATEENKESKIQQTDTTEGEIKRIGTSKDNASHENIERMTNSQENYAEENLEEMRSHQPDLNRGTIIETHHSRSESTGDITYPQEPTILTSSSQDGGHKMSEIETSNEMTDILKSIFNTSRNRDETSLSERKRKLYVDKSVQAVQTPRVTWEEMRANFFVGTPKIFRLCACNDHVCH